MITHEVQGKSTKKSLGQHFQLRQSICAAINSHHTGNCPGYQAVDRNADFFAGVLKGTNLLEIEMFVSLVT